MQHADSLYRYALSRVKDHHAAEDLVQDCLSAAWQRINTFDGRSSLGSWLIGIMKFKVIDHFRKSKRTPTDQAAEADKTGQDPVDSLFTSKGAWKVDPNHGLEMLANSGDAGRDVPDPQGSWTLLSQRFQPVQRANGQGTHQSESTRLRVHLMMCGLCRRLPAQFQALRNLVKTSCEHEHGEECTSECLPDEAKARIIERLKNTKPQPYKKW